MISGLFREGTISVENGSTVATGTGTQWADLLDRGAFVWVGDEKRPGIIASRRRRVTDVDADSQPAGTFIENDTFRWLDPWHGTTETDQPYVAAVFGAHADLNENLVRLLADLAGNGLVGGGYGPPPETGAREKYIWINWTTGVMSQRRGGVWVAFGGGLIGQGYGNWEGHADRTELVLGASPAETEIDASTGDEDEDGSLAFAVTIDGNTEFLLPTNVEVGSVIDVLATISGGPHEITFAEGYSLAEDFALHEGDGARTRLRITVTEVESGDATAAEVALYTFPLSAIVDDRGHRYLSNVADNSAEPQIYDDDSGRSSASWTYLDMPTVAQILNALGVHSITVSESEPTGGEDGDLWFKVEPA